MRVQKSLRPMILAASLASLATLAACGQRGPLYLPERPPKPPSAVTPDRDGTTHSRPTTDASRTNAPGKYPNKNPSTTSDSKASGKGSDPWQSQQQQR